MAKMSLARLALALLLPSAALACGFARLGGALPAGHAPVSCPNFAPGVPYGLASGGAFIPDLTYDGFILPRTIANLSTQYNVSLCYYSMQVLPSPPSGTLPGGNCTWDAPPAVADVMDLYALATQAMQRMQALIAFGAFAGSQCGGGSTNVRALCAAFPGSARCVPALLNQRSLWAVASNIVELTAATVKTLILNDTRWHNSPDWHLPAIGSSLVESGWSSGGAISYKVVECDRVPAGLRGIAIDCDVIDPATGVAVWDEAFAWWEAYTAPAWLSDALARVADSLPRARV